MVRGGVLDQTPMECFVEYHPRPVMTPIPAIGPEVAGERGDGVAPVVVPRAAREPEAPGERERPGGVVDRESDLAGGDLHGAREARVDVDMRDVVDPDAGKFESARRPELDGRRRVQVHSMGEKPVVVRVGS